MGKWYRRNIDNDDDNYRKIYYRNVKENIKRKQKPNRHSDKRILSDANLNQLALFGYGKDKDFVDDTGLQMRPYDRARLKNYNVYATDVKQHIFTNRSSRLTLLFHYKKNKNFKKVNINNYLSIDNGSVKPLAKLTPDKLYDIAKKATEDMYFLIVVKPDETELLVPLPKWAAIEVFKNGAKISLNDNNHVEKVIDKNGNILKPPKNDVVEQLQDFFNKNISCEFPYAFSDCVIRKRILTYKHKFVQKNGKIKTLISQYTNELTGGHSGGKKEKKIKRFMRKVRQAWLKTTRIQDREYLFTGSYPLYHEKHMVAFVMVIKKNKAFVYMVNNNGIEDAKKRYALPLKRDFERYIKEYIPELNGKIDYKFINNDTQVGPTCLTYADYVTRHLAKDPKACFDGKGVDIIKIILNAVQRGIATTVYHSIKKNGKFIPDNIDKLEKKPIVNACPKLDKNIRDMFTSCKNESYNFLQSLNVQPLISKNSRNMKKINIANSEKYRYYQMDKKNKVLQQSIANCRFR